MDLATLILLIEFFLFALLVLPVFMTRYLVRRNQARKALTWAKTTLAAGRVFPFWRGLGHTNVATCYILLDDFAAAQPHAEQAVAYFERHPTRIIRPHLAIASAYLGLSLARSGQMEQAEQRLDSALSLGIRNRNLRAMTESYAANVYLQRGRMADAARLMEQVLALPKISEDQRIVAENLLALQKYYDEDFAGGLALARLAMQRKTAFPRLAIGATVTAQFCLIQLGDFQEARNLEAGILSQIADVPRHIQAGALRASAELALKLGNLDRAREQAERAAVLDPAPNAQAGAMLIQAEVFAARQNFQRAQSLTDAVRRSDAIDFYQRRAHALQARLTTKLMNDE